MNLENLVLYVAFTMGKASSLDLSTDFCRSAFHGGLVSHMKNVSTSTGTSSMWRQQLTLRKVFGSTNTNASQIPDMGEGRLNIPKDSAFV